jgi:hypothetical protein
LRLVGDLGILFRLVTLDQWSRREVLLVAT